ncbi:MAG: YbhN family protein [Acidimicrobiales bacterium]
MTEATPPPITPEPPTSAGNPTDPAPPGAVQPVGPAPHSTRSLVTRVVTLLIAAVTFYLVLPAVVRVVGAWPKLAGLEPGWLALAVAAEVASFACNFDLQRIVLRTRGWFGVVAAGLVGNAVTNIFPGGDAAGAAVQFKMLSQAGIDADDAAGGLAATSLLGVGGLFASPVFALPAVLGGTRVSPGLLHAALLGLAGFVLLAIGGTVVMTTDRPLAAVGRFAQWLWNHLPFRHRKVSGVDHRLLSERDDVRAALGRQGRLAVLLVAGKLGFDYLCLLAVLHATGDDANPSLVLLAYAAAQIVALIPLTPGGIGIVEASLTGILVLAGVQPAQAVVATLAYRLTEYWIPLLAGLVIYPFYRRRFGPISFSHSTTDPRSPKQHPVSSPPSST